MNFDRTGDALEKRIDALEKSTERALAKSREIVAKAVDLLTLIIPIERAIEERAAKSAAESSAPRVYYSFDSTYDPAAVAQQFDRLKKSAKPPLAAALALAMADKPADAE